jgi:hypothetical protein
MPKQARHLHAASETAIRRAMDERRKTGDFKTLISDLYDHPNVPLVRAGRSVLAITHEADGHEPDPRGRKPDRKNLYCY